ncbi:dATP/dGTP diphosphohydrolase domain-containing protein [Bradyrhizobium sp. S3.7.6]
MTTLPANPKDRFGIRKVSLSKVPAVAIAHEAHAMMDGAEKYGPFNWRENAIITSIYIDACRRHIDAYYDAREQCAPDSEAHHLGHARACLGIILDAEATGNLIDDRPKAGMITAVFNKIAATIERRLSARIK